MYCVIGCTGSAVMDSGRTTNITLLHTLKFHHLCCIYIPVLVITCNWYSLLHEIDDESISPEALINMLSSNDKSNKSTTVEINQFHTLLHGMSIIPSSNGVCLLFTHL